MFLKTTFIKLFKKFSIFFIRNLFNSTANIESILSVINQKNSFDDLKYCETFEDPNLLYENLFSHFRDEKINLLEFGTYEGKSIKKFLSLNSNRCSKFYGFDSFLGLPALWRKGFDKGAFNVNGRVPIIDDNRVTFIKGYFQNTLPKFILENKFEENLFVHYDADLFSSTLFCLLKLDTLKIPYFAIFDEFYPDEVFALKKYIDMTSAKVEMIGKVKNPISNVPIQVSCKIIPSEFFEV